MRYLPLIYDRLVARLEDADNLAFAQSACDELCDADLYRFDPKAQAARVRGAGSLDRAQRKRLVALVAWRDGMAREQDAPPRTLLKDGVLLDLARTPVRSADEFRGCRGIPKPIKHSQADAVVKLSRVDGDGRAGTRPAGRLTRAQERQVDTLHAIVRAKAEARGINPAVVTSKKQITRLVRDRAANRDPATAGLTTGWRRELLGDAIDAALAEAEA